MSDRAELTVAEDTWLSRVMGCPAFNFADTTGAESTLARASRGGRAFGFARVPASDLNTFHASSEAAFRVVDVGLTFERPSDSEAPPPSAGVRVSVGADAGPVLDIAGGSFIYSRFHLDPLFPEGVADEIKRAWISSYLAGQRGERLLVCEAGGAPAGFLADLEVEEGGSRVRLIDLIAVGKTHQGAGVGSRLVGFFLADNADRCDLFRVGTQAANVPSVRLYEKFGFRLASAQYVMHAHYADGRAVLPEG